MNFETWNILSRPPTSDDREREREASYSSTNLIFFLSKNRITLFQTLHDGSSIRSIIIDTIFADVFSLIHRKDVAIFDVRFVSTGFDCGVKAYRICRLHCKSVEMCVGESSCAYLKSFWLIWVFNFQSPKLQKLETIDNNTKSADILIDDAHFFIGW